MLTLISATPSPYARKNRIAMTEKDIQFELKSEIPRHSDTETPKYNPLEKLPILIFDDGRPPIYESRYIQEYIVCKYKGRGPDLMPDGEDDQLKVRQIQVLADGACDAMGLVFFETARGNLKSPEWEARQLRKEYGVLKACDDSVRSSGGKFLVMNEFSVEDIAVGAMLGMMNMVQTKFGIIQWSENYPELKRYWEMLEARESFQQTEPYMFDLTEKVA
ncbi:Glutathione S-transferase U11 [Hyphodiscus hymeniophilus]|uniref:Glutathione S-transferase U11 n=1 Tax=Hyphodiscus hymeniophilus TaxID=353542 RepID=A0A9P6VQU7_9HELO|nr:Glutathione S-transferase U11 [Hyphodiscus hymeniophilus]